MHVRPAGEHDVAVITEISNALIDTTTIEWRTAHHTVEARLAWLRAREVEGHPVLVAEDSHGAVVGFATYGWFRDVVKTPGYRRTVEHTVHVRESHWGHGVGRALVEALLDHARAAGIHVVVAGVDGANEASIGFHEQLGFRRVAHMPQVGFKHGRWLDLVLLQRELDDQPAPGDS